MNIFIFLRYIYFLKKINSSTKSNKINIVKYQKSIKYIGFIDIIYNFINLIKKTSCFYNIIRIFIFFYFL